MFKAAPAPAPDYESRDANKDNVYEVTVEATDGVGYTGTKDVKVTVTNKDEVGTVTMSQLQPRVGVPITASVTDLDGDVSNVTWQWSNGSGVIVKATSAPTSGCGRRSRSRHPDGDGDVHRRGR